MKPLFPAITRASEKLCEQTESPSLQKEWELQGPVKEPRTRGCVRQRGRWPRAEGSCRGCTHHCGGAAVWGKMFCSNVWWGITSTKGNIRLNRSGRFRWHFVCSFSYVRVSVFDKTILRRGTVSRSDWKVEREWNSIESGAWCVGAFSPHSCFQRVLCVLHYFLGWIYLINVCSLLKWASAQRSWAITDTASNPCPRGDTQAQIKNIFLFRVPLFLPSQFTVALQFSVISA